MKKFILCFFLIVSIRLSSQVVFCPSGAEWRCAYRVYSGPPNSPYYIKQIKYTGDSVLGTVGSVKKIEHDMFFRDFCGYPVTKSLILEKNNKVYFRNDATHNNWQMLYDFTCTQGQGWTTKIYDDATNYRTYSFTVDSTSIVTFNNISLKRLYCGGLIITERIGCNWSFFPFDSEASGWCDGLNFVSLVCYQDDELGMYENPNIPCNYATGVDNQPLLTTINFFPNPVGDILILSRQEFQEDLNVQIKNLTGQLIQEHMVIEKNFSTRISLTDLSNGIYFLEIYDKKNLILRQKLVKE